MLQTSYTAIAWCMQPPPWCGNHTRNARKKQATHKDPNERVWAKIFSYGPPRRPIEHSVGRKGFPFVEYSSSSIILQKKKSEAYDP